jgi:hypothetical protein
MEHEGVTVTLTKKAALASLAKGRKRERINDAQIVTKLPSAVKALINEVATKDGVSDATITREALGEYFERRGYRG